MAKIIGTERKKKLRKLAEKIISEKPQIIGELDPTDIKKLVHELHIHQIELEMQNEELRRVQLELQESRDKYQELYESTPTGYCILDQSSLIVNANPSIGELLGMENHKLIGMKFTDFISPDFQDMFYLHRKEVSKTGAKGICELKMLRADSTPFYTQMVSNVILIKNNNISRHHISITDITEHRLIALSLRKNEQRLKEAEKLGKIGNWEFDINTQKVEWSDMVYTLYERDKALGPPSPEKEATYYAPEEARRLREFARLAMENGEELNYDFTAKLPSGNTVLFNAWIRPVKDEEGRVIKLFGTVQDITERKRAEERYRSLFEQSRDPIFITIRSGEYVDFNQSMLDLFGYTRKELMGMNVTETYSIPANRRQFQKAIEQKGFVQDYETKFRKKDGTEVECLLTSTLRLDDNGNILGYQGIIRDVTGHNQVKIELEKSYTSLQKAVEATVKAIALTSEIRDPYTAGHQQRVAELACAIAKKMGLDEEQIETINMAGILHDIGKIYVPAEILSRPNKLNEIEMNMIRAHAQVGCDILEALELPWAICPIVLQHHERIDGSGYPAGLSDGDILIEARIIAVADVVEAMSSHRPYRPALGIDAALNEIQQNRGKLYDPDVVDICLTLFEEKEFKLKEPSRISIASSLI